MAGTLVHLFVLSGADLNIALVPGDGAPSMLLTPRPIRIGAYADGGHVTYLDKPQMNEIELYVHSLRWLADSIERYVKDKTGGPFLTLTTGQP